MDTEQISAYGLAKISRFLCVKAEGVCSWEDTVTPDEIIWLLPPMKEKAQLSNGRPLLGPVRR